MAEYKKGGHLENSNIFATNRLFVKNKLFKKRKKKRAPGVYNPKAKFKYENGGEKDYIELDLSEEDIQKYIDGGYIVEEVTDPSIARLNRFIGGGTLNRFDNGGSPKSQWIAPAEMYSGRSNVDPTTGLIYKDLSDLDVKAGKKGFKRKVQDFFRKDIGKLTKEAEELGKGVGYIAGVQGDIEPAVYNREGIKKFKSEVKRLKGDFNTELKNAEKKRKQEAKDREDYEQARKKAQSSKDPNAGSKFAREYEEKGWDRFDENVMKEGYKGQFQDAVDEANARKEANMGVTNTALELLGGGAYRIIADPLGTAKGVAQTIGDVATLPLGLGEGGYNYATKGNFDMGVNPLTGANYGEGLSQTFDVLGAIPGIGAAGKLAKFTKAGDLVGDVGKGLKTLGKTAKSKYVDIAEGDNVFDYAWRSPASRFDDAAMKTTQEMPYPQSQSEFDKLRSLDNLTDQEKVMIKDYETYSRHYTGRGMQDWNVNPYADKKNAFEQTIANAKVQSDEPFVMTRRINTENPELFSMNKGVYEPKRITSWSAGRDNIGNTSFSGGKDRLVIKNKAGESNVFKNPYEGLTDAQKQLYREMLKKENPGGLGDFIDKHIEDFADINRSYERELILPADAKLKQLGKVKNKMGGYDYVMRRHALGGSTDDYIEIDIPEEKIQWYIDNGYIVEPVSKLKKFIS